MSVVTETSIRFWRFLHHSLSSSSTITELPKAGFNLEKIGNDVKGAAIASFTALTIATNVLTNEPAQAYVDFPGTSSIVVSEKVIREGLYQDYEVDLVQEYDDARSTYKPAKETKSNKGMCLWSVQSKDKRSEEEDCKYNEASFYVWFFVFSGKYTSILAVLIVGSFVIPMAQYFWYVKDDDTTDRFFEEKGIKKTTAKAPEPAKKKGWFS